MTSRSNPDTPDAPSTEFKSVLERLVLESFADGLAVKGTWEVTSPSPFVPNWRVTIEKTDEADLPEENPTFLDE